MESDQAIEALGALAHGTRLALFRLLAAGTGEGMAAGEIAERLGVVPSTLSHHLAALERPGLIRSTRQQRHLLYAVNPPAVRGLVEFLTDQCCGGRPDLCGGSREPGGNGA
ncbi:metalloregulator ArsR/SmtB family transcription factor [Sphingobium sp. BYY-5]|uniref:ArsR/SmtB family transcription factor n=1 Tax=Sphingobium sp. BYY-5 TaxID=2926400 RepID=UPI001FA6DEFC|nr:metalloregulator ArsR/SmtB family transcription factor [Sphingobium sp. BYY-5]MCI4588516.1 metalloregulator ArsR/SmtB family transcription factor [Sphingobium sp. BYY-5]